MQGKRLILLAASFFIATLSGCGSSLDSGGDSTAADALREFLTAAGYAGADKCIECHDDFAWSYDIVAKYLSAENKHLINGMDASAEHQAEGCLDCHDPVGDGRLLEDLISDPDDVPEEGLAAVTCEACHGKGGEHYGSGPFPANSDPTPDYDDCGQCHAELTGNHLVYHPEANNIITNFKASKHFEDDPGHADNVCTRCHTDEGGREYRNIDNRAMLYASALEIENPSTIQCRTCHDPHMVGDSGLLMQAIEKSSHGSYPPFDATAEYATCVNCHQGDNAAVVDLAANMDLTNDQAATDPGLLAELIYHEDRHMRVITDSHYDDPATPVQIEGYVVDRNGVKIRPCLDCHDVHSVKEIRADRDTTTINDQWAQSAHGGHLLTFKKAAMEAAAEDRTSQQTQDMKEAGPTEDDTVWADDHDWDHPHEATCQRCHTATGARNYMTDPEGYITAIDAYDANLEAFEDEGADLTVASPNDYSHLEGWTADDLDTPQVDESDSSGQAELLYCWACHANNSGDLRAPGAIMPGYKAADGVADAQFPDVFGSNVCLACHTGRSSGGDIKADTDDFSDNKGFINSHYLSAGGTVFTTTGYEFDVDGSPATDDYEDVSYFHHDEIGMGTNEDLADWEAGHGTNGPCVGCHMSTPDNSHSYLPVRRVNPIAAITSTVCVNCHAGEHGDPFVPEVGDDGEENDPADVAAAAAVLNEEDEGFEAALNALAAQLNAVGHPFKGGYPYFDPGDWTNDDTYNGKHVMGAAFNFNLLLHDPGAYAHNRYYAKRLIYDAIDYLDDGLFNASVGSAIENLEDGDTYGGDTLTTDEAAAAAAYLDGDGDTAGVQRPPA